MSLGECMYLWMVSALLILYGCEYSENNTFGGLSGDGLFPSCSTYHFFLGTGYVTRIQIRGSDNLIRHRFHSEPLPALIFQFKILRYYGLPMHVELTFTVENVPKLSIRPRNRCSDSRGSEMRTNVPLDVRGSCHLKKIPHGSSWLEVTDLEKWFIVRR